MPLQWLVNKNENMKSFQQPALLKIVRSDMTLMEIHRLKLEREWESSPPPGILNLFVLWTIVRVRFIVKDVFRGTQRLFSVKYLFGEGNIA